MSLKYYLLSTNVLSWISKKFSLHKIEEIEVEQHSTFTYYLVLGNKAICFLIGIQSYQKNLNESIFNLYFREKHFS